MIEPSFIHRGKKLRPDLIAYNGISAVVVDVTVRYETNSPDLLAAAYREKVRKYQVLRPQILEQELGRQVSFHGVVLGCRGAWPSEVSDVPLNELGINSWNFTSTVARRALLMFCDILHCLKGRVARRNAVREE